ncbi:MAG: hypothetical protein K2X47_05235 [Bdellovibrionales bacterium]|nr:hypothetical protein [Bdellovibrionales bacterium]
MSLYYKRNWVASASFFLIFFGGAVVTMQNCTPQEPVRSFGNGSRMSSACELVPPPKSVYRQGEAIAFSAQFQGLDANRYRASLFRVSNPRDEQIGSGKSFFASDSFVRVNFSNFSEATAVGTKSYFVRLSDSSGEPVCESEPVELNINGTSSGGTTQTIAIHPPTYSPGSQTTEIVITPQSSFTGLAYVENPSNPNARITIGGNIGCPSNVRITRESPTEVRGTFASLTQSTSGCQVEMRYQTSSGVVVGTVESAAIPPSASGGAIISALSSQAPYSVRTSVSAILIAGNFPGISLAPTVRLSGAGCPSSTTIESFGPTQVIASFSHLQTASQCTVDLSYVVGGQTRAVQGSVTINRYSGISISSVDQEDSLYIRGSFPGVPTNGSGLSVSFVPGIGSNCPSSTSFVSADTSLVRVNIPSLAVDATNCRLRVGYSGLLGEISSLNLTRQGSSSQAVVNPGGVRLYRGEDMERDYTYMEMYGSYPELPEASSQFRVSVTSVSGTNCPSSISTTYERGGASPGQINARYRNLRKEATNCRFRIQYLATSGTKMAEFVIPRIPAIPSLFSSTVSADCSQGSLLGHNIAPEDTAIVFYVDNGTSWDLLEENGQEVRVITLAPNYSILGGRESVRFTIPTSAKLKLADPGVRFTLINRMNDTPLDPPHDQPTWDVGERLICSP